MFAARSNRASPGLPMKFVATPRPDRNERKSTVGPWMAPIRPPAHSIWATLRPRGSAAWAIVSAWRMPGVKAGVALPNGWPLTWNVLFVDPWTPGQAPVASVYHPAPVFGGACVRRPLPSAWLPFLRSPPNVGMTPSATYAATLSWRSPSEAKKTALSVLGGLAADAVGTTVTSSRMTLADASRRERERLTDSSSRATGMIAGRAGARGTATSSVGRSGVSSDRDNACGRRRLTPVDVVGAS